MFTYKFACCGKKRVLIHFPRADTSMCRLGLGHWRGFVSVKTQNQLSTPCFLCSSYIHKKLTKSMPTWMRACPHVFTSSMCPHAAHRVEHALCAQHTRCVSVHSYEHKGACADTAACSTHQVKCDVSDTSPSCVVCQSCMTL